MQEIINNISLGQIVIDVTIAIALSSGITYFLSKFISERIADKLRINWEREEKEKLMELQQKIDHEHTLFKGILDSYSSNNQFSQTVRMNAVQKIWKKLLEFRERGHFTLAFYGIVRESTLPKINEYDAILKVVKRNLTDEYIGSYMNDILNSHKEIEEYRPFISEKLWYYYVTYTLFVGTISYHLNDGIKNKYIVTCFK